MLSNAIESSKPRLSERKVSRLLAAQIAIVFRSVVGCALERARFSTTFETGMEAVLVEHNGIPILVIHLRPSFLT